MTSPQTLLSLLTACALFTPTLASAGLNAVEGMDDGSPVLMDDESGPAIGANQIQIPEPMVFDLVRGLGARAGELEANTLFISPLRRGPAELAWAPEVEWAPIDDLALELELPMVNAELEAVKLALQQTFDSNPTLPLQHGAQAIVEHQLNHRLTEVTALYLLGLRFNPRWSIFTMFGARAGIAPHEELALEYIQNVTLFREISETITFGVETNIARDGQGATTSLAIAQVHWTPLSFLAVQVGAGASHQPGGTTPYMGGRIIFQAH